MSLHNIEVVLWTSTDGLKGSVTRVVCLSRLWQIKYFDEVELDWLRSEIEWSQWLCFVDVVSSVAGHLGDRHLIKSRPSAAGMVGCLWLPASVTFTCGANLGSHLQIPSGFHHC